MVVLGLIAAGAISVAVGGLSIVAGKRWGLIDRPDQDLKPHQGEPVPLGGLGLLIGLHVGMSVAGVFDPGLFAATVLIWAVGLIDDLWGLSSLIRLVATAASGVTLIALTDLPRPGIPDVVWIIAVVVVVNAVNLLDGLDALGGSVTLVAASGLSVFALVQDLDAWWVALILAMVLLGFLFWNRPMARLYLGDNGAYVIGVALVWVAMQSGTDPPSDLVALALIGVPLLDLGITVLRRLMARTPLFAGDRDHTYDRLFQTGWGIAAVVGLFAGIQVIWSSTLIWVSVLTGDVPALIVALGLGAFVVIVALVLVKRHRLAA